MVTQASQTLIQEAVTELNRGSGFILIEGSSGCGKTQLIEPLSEVLRKQYRVLRLPYSRLDFAELLKLITAELQLNCDSDDSRTLYTTLHTFAHRCQVERRPLLLIIDDAQALSNDSFTNLNRAINSTSAERMPLRGVLLAEKGFGEHFRLQHPENKLISRVLHLGSATEAEMQAFIEQLRAHNASDLSLSEAAIQVLVMESAGSFHNARQLLNMAIIEARAAGLDTITDSLIDTVRDNHAIGSSHSLFEADAAEHAPEKRARALVKEDANLPPELEGILLQSLTATPDKPRLKGSDGNRHQPLFMNDLENPAPGEQVSSAAQQGTSSAHSQPTAEPAARSEPAANRSAAQPTASPSATATSDTAPLHTDPSGSANFSANERSKVQPPAHQHTPQRHTGLLIACLCFALIAAGLLGAHYLGIDLKAWGQRIQQQVQQHILEWTDQAPPPATTAVPANTEPAPDTKPTITEAGQPTLNASKIASLTQVSETADLAARETDASKTTVADNSIETKETRSDRAIDSTPTAVSLTTPDTIAASEPDPMPSEPAITSPPTAAESAPPAENSALAVTDTQATETLSSEPGLSETETSGDQVFATAPSIGENTDPGPTAADTMTAQAASTADQTTANSREAISTPQASVTDIASSDAAPADTTASTPSNTAPAGPDDSPERYQQEARDAQVRLLLKRAEIHRKAFRFTIPKDSNAVISYRKVLDLEPDNDEAREGIEWIRQRYYARAEAAIGKQNWAAAAQNYARLLWMNPEDETALQGAKVLQQRLGESFQLPAEVMQ